MNELNRDNFRILLAAFMEKQELPVRRIAGAIKCSEATLQRLLAHRTQPSDEMLRQGAFLIELGFERYSRLSTAEREKLSTALGAIGGGVIGFGSVTATVGAMGSVAGLSAAGISSGLGAMGAIVSGGMAAGVAVAAAIPIAAAGMGYGIIRAVKYFVSEQQLNAKAHDPQWEIPSWIPRKHLTGRCRFDRLKAQSSPTTSEPLTAPR
jgi:hypothetical protein